MKTQVWKEHELIGFEIVWGGVTEQMGGGRNQSSTKRVQNNTTGIFGLNLRKSLLGEETIKETQDQDRIGNLGLGQNRKHISRKEQETQVQDRIGNLGLGQNGKPRTRKNRKLISWKEQETYVQDSIRNLVLGQNRKPWFRIRQENQDQDRTGNLELCKNRKPRTRIDQENQDQVRIGNLGL